METVDPAWYAAEAERVRKAGVDLDHAAALHSRASDAFLHSAAAIHILPLSAHPPEAAVTIARGDLHPAGALYRQSSQV